MNLLGESDMTILRATIFSKERSSKREQERAENHSILASSNFNPESYPGTDLSGGFAPRPGRFRRNRDRG